MPKTKKFKKIPKFNSEAEEREFWENTELGDYFDLDNPIDFDFSNLKPSTQSVTLRMSSNMVDDIKGIANKRDVPYQSLIKVYLAEKIKEEDYSTRYGEKPIPKK